MIKNQSVRGKRSIWHWRHLWLVLAGTWIFICAPARGQQNTSLEWNPVTNATVAGYYLFAGNVSGEYYINVDMGTNTIATISGLDWGTNYFFAVTSYDTNGVQSNYSSEVTVTPQAPDFFAGEISLRAVLSDTAYVTNMTPGTLRNDYSGYVGMKVVVGSSSITVTELGRIMVAGNTGTHVVKLVNASDGTDVPGGAVTIGMTGGTAGQFQYGTLSVPVTLTAGASYYLASQETKGGDFWYNANTTENTTTVAAESAGVFGPGLGAWLAYGTAGEAFGPVDFKYATGAAAPANPGIVDYLQFPNGNGFGFYNLEYFPWVYHYDLGWEYFIDANDGRGGVYFYDYSSGTFWYTSATLFPYLYDFTLNTWLFYYVDTQNPGHFTSNPREFYDFSSQQAIAK